MTARPTVDGVTVHLARHNVATLDLFNDEGDTRRVVVPGGTTVIVGNLWLTLKAGDQKWVLSPDLSYRIATEQDVLAWQPVRDDI